MKEKHEISQTPANDGPESAGAGTTAKTNPGGGVAKGQSREDRLAEALRANLRRRKSAARKPRPE